MKTHYSTLSARLRALLAIAIPLIATGPAEALDGAVQKIFGKWKNSSITGAQLGAESRSTACSAKWIVCGAPFAAERGVIWEGAVHVFNAKTRAWTREILPPAESHNQLRFGRTIAISGDLAAITATTTNSSGRVYIYNLATGALVRTITAFDASSNAHFGGSLAIHGNTLIVSAYGDDAGKGAVYLFDFKTGAFLSKITRTGGAAGENFGISIAADGGILAVGAHRSSANRGLISFYDLATQSLIRTHQPLASVSGDYIGYALAMNQGLVVIGGVGKAFVYDLASGADYPLLPPASPISTIYFGETVAIDGPTIAVGDVATLSNQGRVHLFEAVSGSRITTLSAPYGDTSAQFFGKSVCLQGSSLLVSAMTESTQGLNMGAAYHFALAPRQLPFTKIAAKGDFAPSGPNINYGVIGEPIVNGVGKTAFTTSLTGPGATTADNAVVSDIVTPATPKLYNRKGISPYGSGPVFKSTGRIVLNDNNALFGLSTLSGPGVGSSNNLMLWFKHTTFAGSSIGLLMRTGEAVGAIGPGILKSIPEIAGSHTAPRVASIFTQRIGSTGAVTAATDSGYISSLLGAGSDVVQEGTATPVSLPVGTLYGQFSPRICNAYQRQVYSTGLAGAGITTANNAAIFWRPHGGTSTLIDQKGSPARNQTGAALGATLTSTFIGESSDGFDNTAYRATITGPRTEVSSATNEGIWVGWGASSDRTLFLRKGDPLTVTGALKIGRLTNFWSAGVDVLAPKVMALVQLSGTGVSSRNDRALLLKTYSINPLVLMREGDPAPSCPGTTISVINRVAFNAESGSYAIIATLSGAPAGTELALFIGNVQRGDFSTQASLRRPHLRLRKGQVWDNQPSPIKSISIANGDVTAAGAASTGRSCAISTNGDLVITVDFNNGVRQVMQGYAD